MTNKTATATGLLGVTVETRGSRFINKVQVGRAEKFFVFARGCGDTRKAVKTIGRFDTLPAARFAMGVSLADAMRA